MPNKFYSSVWSTFALLLFGLITLSNQQTAYASSGTPDGSFNPSIITSGGGVTAIATQSDGKIIIGGSFVAINGVNRNNLARLNADGSVDNNFLNGMSGINLSGISGNVLSVRAITIQPDGKILVGGYFSNVNGVAKIGLARLNVDGSVDPAFSTPISAESDIFLGVDAIALQPDGKILVGGLFFADGVRRTIVRLNTDGSLDSAFSNDLFGPDGPVETIALQPDGKILIGGFFSNVNFTPRKRVARLNTDGSLDLGFVADCTEPSVAEVLSIVLQPDGKILIGGNFMYVNNTPRQHIARLNTDGSLDANFMNGQPGPNDQVWDITLQPDGKILIGGFFTNVNNFDRKYMARLENNGNIDSSFQMNSTVRPFIRTLAIQSDGKILIGGFFYKIDNAERNSLARLNSDGSLDSSFLDGLAGTGRVGNPEKIALQPDGKILVGGYFTIVNGISRKGIVRLNTDGSLDTNFSCSVDQPDIPGGVSAFAVQPDGKIIIGGRFSRVNGVSRNNLARLNSDGSVDTSFAVNSYPNNAVKSILIQPDGKILIGGLFDNYNLQLRRGLARINSDGSLDETFPNLFPLVENTNVSVNVIALQPDGNILVGGQFRYNVNGEKLNLARVSPDGSFDVNFLNGQSGSNGTILEIVLQPDGKILVSGGFSIVNGTERRRIARLNVDGSIDTSFINIPQDQFLAGAVSIALQPNGKIVVGGAIEIQQEDRGVARLNSDGSLDSTFISRFNGYGIVGRANSIARQSNGKILAVGTFSEVNGIHHFGIVRLLDHTTSSDFDGDGRTDVSVFRPSDSVWHFLNSSNNSYRAQQFGISTDRLAPADYDGDGKTDIAVFRDGVWYILQSSNNSVRYDFFGLSGDAPQPGDFDGDGRADIAVWRPSNGVWHIKQSSNNSFIAYQFGMDGDVPTTGDYDGDGKTDVAVFRPSSGTWYLLQSAAGFTALPFGLNGDIPTVGDYDGDGKTDITVWRPSNGVWYLLQSTAGFAGVQFGLNGDRPTPGDYDGDGKTDVAVFRPSNGFWYSLRSASGVNIQPFGMNGDVPLPSAYIP